MIRITDNNGNRYQLDGNHSLGSGGEGEIFSIGGGKVVKLYHNSKDALPDDKIAELSKLDGSFFVKPQCAVHGDRSGYIMEELNLSEYYPIYSLYAPSFAQKRGISPDYRNVLAEKIIRGVKNAHDNNIVIGDLNPFNVMVNDALDVKFIDVDSYQTKSYRHNDKLLEEVRDYYYNGVVSEDSDYFALSVMIFNLFTGIHPYKGMHKVYRDKLKEREINNISLLNEAEISNIKTPKFYSPLSDGPIKDMLYEVFQLNKRFLLDMKGKRVSAVQFTAIVQSNNLLIKEIVADNAIKSVQASRTAISVSFSDKRKTRLFTAPGRGITMNLAEVDPKERLIVTDKEIYSLLYGHLRHYDRKTGQFEDVTSLEFPTIRCVKQYENLLVVITDNDRMYTIRLDNYNMGHVAYDITNTYAKSFVKIDGMHQVLGNSSVIFYNSGGRLQQYILRKRIYDVVQSGTTGIYTVNEKNKVRHFLFTIDRYGTIKEKEISDRFPYTANDKFVILYEDEKLHFLDKETLNEVVSFEATGLDGLDVQFTDAGILAYGHGKVLLLNTK